MDNLKLLSLIMLLLLGGLVTFVNYKTSFHVTADSEALSIKVPANRMLNWHASEIRIKTTREIKKLASGSFTIMSKVELRLDFERTTSSLYVNIRGDENDAGFIEDSSGQRITLDKNNYLELKHEEQQSTLVSSVTLPIDGRIIVGRAANIIDGFAPMLFNGRVVVRGHSLLTRDLTIYNSHNLSLGDAIVPNVVSGFLNREKQLAEASGFIRIGSPSAFKVVVDVVADEVQIQHYRGKGYILRLSLIDKIKNDRTIQAIWLAFGTLLLFWKKIFGKADDS